MRERMMSGWMVCLILCMTYSVGAEDQLTNLVNDFSHADWAKVRQAKTDLENLSNTKETISRLLERGELGGTARLKYTGNTYHPGRPRRSLCGSWYPYRLDRIEDRVGWYIEEMTFQDFGFVEPGRNKDAFRNAVAWWQGNRKTWTRVDALEDAISSDDTRRQELAISWLYYRRSYCKGLEKEKYLQRIHPFVEKLASSSSTKVAALAKKQIWFVDNGHWHWLEHKRLAAKPEAKK